MPRQVLATAEHHTTLAVARALERLGWRAAVALPRRGALAGPQGERVRVVEAVVAAVVVRVEQRGVELVLGVSMGVGVGEHVRGSEEGGLV